MRRLCLETGCGHDATYRGRCRAHQRKRNRETSPNQALYNKAKWKNTRRAYLHEQGGLCERCGKVAQDVHHKQALQDGGSPWSMDNLEALCHACHSATTRQEQMATAEGLGGIADEVIRDLRGVPALTRNPTRARSHPMRETPDQTITEGDKVEGDKIEGDKVEQPQEDSSGDKDNE